MSSVSQSQAILASLAISDVSSAKGSTALQLDPLTIDFWWLIGTAILCGGIIGLERELRDKPTGLRTCILICVGTSLFIRTGMLMNSEHSDPTRVLGQVVSGIGFLGGGVILSRGRILTGVTTASVVWLLASIGALVGLGHFGAAMVISVVMVLLLVVLEYIETLISPRASKHVHVETELPRSMNSIDGD